jgi:uncharacterized integral membrane protein (TIGR00698 family)
MKSPLRFVPGLACVSVVTLAALALQAVQHRLLGRVWIESLVLAILAGAMWRSFLPLPSAAQQGISLAAHRVLEVAIALLGTQIAAASLLHGGLALLAGVAVVVAASPGGAFAMARLLGLGWRLATLIACGNSICGNSAVAAVAPVIGAEGGDIAAAIGFTAVFGIATVLALPPLGAALHLDAHGYGALTGLTVYAVPQVLAAAAPMGAGAVHLATLVKLTRVLMLGPVCAALSMASRGAAPRAGGGPALVPWFILAFMLFMALRAAGLFPAGLLAPAAALANGLTLLAMAGLGLSTDLRQVAGAGPRVLLAVALSLAWLGAISLGLVSALGL